MPRAPAREWHERVQVAHAFSANSFLVTKELSLSQQTGSTQVRTGARASTITANTKKYLRPLVRAPARPSLFSHCMLRSALSLLLLRVFAMAADRPARLRAVFSDLDGTLVHFPSWFEEHGAKIVSRDAEAKRRAAALGLVNGGRCAQCAADCVVS